MPLDVIYPGSISNMSHVPGHPVFMLTLGGATAPSLVVKGEQVAGDESDADITLSAKWAGRLMKHVNNPDAAVKALSPQEMQEFRPYAIAKFGANSEACRNFNDRRVWVKMKYVPNLSDAEFTKRVPKLGKPLQTIETIERSKLKSLVKLFLKDETWEQLGRVVAVDLFNTNLDRFRWTSANQVSVANEGNILFASDGEGDAKRTFVLGLDAFHAGEAHQTGANLNKPLAEFPSARVGLDILRTDQNRQIFARSCTEAVAEQIRRRMRSSKENERAELPAFKIKLENADELVTISIENILALYGAFEESFATGLADGMSEMRDYLLRKKREYELAAQNAARALGPIPQGGGPAQGWGPARGGGPVQGGGPALGGVGGHRGAPQLGAQRGPLPLNQGALPGGQRPGPLQGGPMVPAPLKTLPRGVLDRMEYLQWR